MPATFDFTSTRRIGSTTPVSRTATTRSPRSTLAVLTGSALRRILTATMVTQPPISSNGSTTKRRMILRRRMLRFPLCRHGLTPIA